MNDIKTDKNKTINLTDSEIVLLCELINLCNIPAKIVSDDPIKGSEIDSSHNGQNNETELSKWAIPSKEYLCKKLSMSKPTVFRGLKKLEEAGLISREKISYVGRETNGINVNKERIENYIEKYKSEEDDIFRKNHFIKLPYVFLKAFKFRDTQDKTK